MTDAHQPATQDVGEKRQCGKCRRRISLVESTIKCRCGLAFCERHMAAENHECAFDWRQMQREKIARENPKVVLQANKLKSSKDWCAQYCKHHPVATWGERCSQLMHLLGALLVVAFNASGIWRAAMQVQIMSWIRQAVLGYCIGFLCAHALPRCCGTPPSSCCFCIFSWDVLSMPQWCLEAEWEQAKEQLIYAITGGKRNCLTRKLYDGPRSLPSILQTVVAKLQEGSQGGFKCS
ncbi:unnamed protein product [Cladocopium goreaui]|uniref:AN1-type domain-containing protein n=1 Tax=Cladocopium goreaui TaxID=2562237 RepID=A0A9P1FGY9_9DINO|nr:unnamed protein product [Cladocopium goreaui]